MAAFGEEPQITCRSRANIEHAQWIFSFQYPRQLGHRARTAVEPLLSFWLPRWRGCVAAKEFHLNGCERLPLGHRYLGPYAWGRIGFQHRFRRLRRNVCDSIL